MVLAWRRVVAREALQVKGADGLKGAHFREIPPRLWEGVPDRVRIDSRTRMSGDTRGRAVLSGPGPVSVLRFGMKSYISVFVASIFGTAVASTPAYADLRPDPTDPTGPYGLIFIVVLVAAGIGIFLYRRRK